MLLFHQPLNLNGVPRVDLRLDLFPYVLIQMLNLFEDASLQLGLSASAFGQIIVTVVVGALIMACLISEVFDNQELLLKDLLEVDDFKLESVFVEICSFDTFFLQLFNIYLFCHK